MKKISCKGDFFCTKGNESKLLNWAKCNLLQKCYKSKHSLVGELYDTFKIGKQPANPLPFKPQNYEYVTGKRTA